MVNDEFKILEIINSERKTTQRHISDLANISLGKTNYLLSNLLDKRLITISKQGKGSTYSLTSEGINFLDNELKSISMKKINLHDTEYKKIKQAVILAIDEVKEFDKPTGFLEIEGITIISRIINILEKNDINNIIIVSGYKNEYYEKLLKNKNITLVSNVKYKHTGTMFSLVLANEFINDDFILIDSNIIFEERALVEVIKSKMRDCMLITSEGSFGNEFFVEIENECISKISKDINMLNRIDGELIGITKISYDIFIKMLKDYENNHNSHLNYKCQIFYSSRNYRIGYIKVDDLVWFKIHNNSHYEKVINTTRWKIKRKEFYSDIKSVKKYIVDCLGVNENDIVDIVPIGGMTNKNYKFNIDNIAYVIRISGNGTEEIIDRRNEGINSKLVTAIGINRRAIYADKNTGIKISKFIDNAETLNCFTAKRQDNMKFVAEILRKLHNSNIKMSSEFNVFERINHYEKNAIKSGGKFYENYDKTKENVLKLKEKIQQLDINLVPCNNDTVPENFIRSGLNKMYLIDWEYSGLNDPIWDISTYCLEAELNEDEEELFLENYFGSNSEKSYRERILIYKICQDFLWSIWTIFKEAKGDDFGTYGFDRFTRVRCNLLKYYREQIEKSR